MRNAQHLQSAVSQNGATYSDEYYTPADYWQALGPFDLDPCAGPVSCIARINIRQGDGLAADWSGLVWCNPPYSRNAKRRWLDKLAKHEGGGIALVPSATDTEWFQDAAAKASAVLLVKGRINFIRPDGKASQNAGGSAYLAFGDVAKARLLAAVTDPHNPIKGILFFP